MPLTESETEETLLLLCLLFVATIEFIIYHHATIEFIIYQHHCTIQQQSTPMLQGHKEMKEKAKKKLPFSYII